MMHRGVVILFVFLVALAVSTSLEKKFGIRFRFLPRIRFSLGAKREYESQGEFSERLAESFNLLDTNGDGVINISEMTDNINTLFPGQLNIKPADLISEADTDRDGNVSYDEFLAKFQNGPTEEE